MKKKAPRRRPEVEPPRLPSPVEMTVARYALLNGDGRPHKCGPSPEERYGVEDRQGAFTPKVVYPDRHNAEQAREALEALPGGVPLYVYLCNRTTYKLHYHLTSRRQRSPGDLNTENEE